MKFEVVDIGGILDPDEVACYAASQQRQIREHYALCFDGDGDEDEYSPPKANYSADFIMRLEPKAPKNAQDAFGFHELGIGHVFLDLASQFNTSWSSIGSHETLEARNDLRLHKCIELDDGTIIDCEVCDRVEAFSYMIDSIELSNFNTPYCFEPPPNWKELIKRPTLDPGLFDWMGVSHLPNQVLKDGYAQRYVPGKGWEQIGEMRPYRQALADMGLGRSNHRFRRSIIQS